MGGGVLSGAGVPSLLPSLMVSCLLLLSVVVASRRRAWDSTRRNNPEGLNANHANSAACSTDVPVHVTFRLRQDEIRNGNLMLPVLGSYACKGLED